MPVALTLLLVLVAVVLLAFGSRGTTGGALRLLGGGAALLIALLATAATIGLFWLGQKNDWTSDGPGALFVMIAVVVCGIVAAVGWLFVLGILGGAADSLDRLPAAGPDARRRLRLAGFALLAAAAVGQAITAYVRRGRAAHASPVVAVSFDSANPRLVSVDAAGTLVQWDLRSRREERRQTRPELAGATELFMADRGYAIVNGQALRFQPFQDAPGETIPDARRIARSGHVFVARERALLFASHSGWTTPPRELPWPEPILAVAANDQFVALADRANVTLLDGRPNTGRTHGSVPAPGAISRLEVLYDGTVIALDGNGAGWSIDVRRGVSEPLVGKASLVAADRHVFLVSGRTVLEYDPRKKTAAELATIGSGARCLDTRGEHVAFGFENGEVVLATRSVGRFETQRLTAAPARPAAR